jgi:hypothetical protein
MKWPRAATDYGCKQETAVDVDFFCWPRDVLSFHFGDLQNIHRKAGRRGPMAELVFQHFVHEAYLEPTRHLNWLRRACVVSASLATEMGRYVSPLQRSCSPLLAAPLPWTVSAASPFCVGRGREGLKLLQCTLPN